MAGGNESFEEISVLSVHTWLRVHLRSTRSAKIHTYMTQRNLHICTIIFGTFCTYIIIDTELLSTGGAVLPHKHNPYLT